MATSPVNVSDAIALIQSGQRVFVHGASATPNVLITELVAQASRLKNVELIHLHTEGPAAYGDIKYKENFRVANLFVGGNLRAHMDYDHVDYIPCFLSEIPQLFRSKRRPLDVALLHVSPPDKHGMCSLGVSIDVAKAAADSASILIAQINQQMPRVHGDGFVHIDDFDAYIEVDEALPLSHCPKISEAEQKIGKLVASLVENGSALQFGIGAIPDAVALSLVGHKDLGIHTEMWSDGTLKLLETGVVTNAYKKVHPGKSVSSFIMGSKKVFDFIHDNPSVVQLESSYVNDPHVIARNPKAVAVNSAVEVDLTGQVCADSIGARIISGVGGQMDFIRGASLSPGGKPIIALTSRTKKGQSRIVTALQTGAGVVTTRAHVHYIVTEYGIADLYGKTIKERANLLIEIAHPEDREALSKGAKHLLATC